MQYLRMPNKKEKEGQKENSKEKNRKEEKSQKESQEEEIAATNHLSLLYL